MCLNVWFTLKTLGGDRNPLPKEVMHVIRSVNLVGRHCVILINLLISLYQEHLRRTML